MTEDETAADHGRHVLLASLAGVLGAAAVAGPVFAARLDPAETEITLPGAIR